MPINVNRITWRDESTKEKIRIIAELECTECGNTFSRTIRLPGTAIKNEIWYEKELASNALNQHKH